MIYDIDMPVYQMYLSDKDKALIDEAKKIAKREGKPLAQLIKQQLAKYVKEHGEGNPAFPLDKWTEQPDFKAFPTLGEAPERYPLEKMSDADLMEMWNKIYAWQYAVGTTINRKSKRTRVLVR